MGSFGLTLPTRSCSFGSRSSEMRLDTTCGLNGELETLKTPNIVPLFRSRCVRTLVSTPKIPGTPCSVSHSSSVFWFDQWLGREREWTTNPLTFTESDSKWSGTPPFARIELGGTPYDPSIGEGITTICSW